MYWNYCNKKTNLPDNMKSDNVIEYKMISVLLASDQNKDDDLSKYTTKQIQHKWEYYKNKQFDSYCIDTECFINGTYKLLYAVIKKPKYTNVLVVVVDKQTNNIYGLSYDLSKGTSLTDVINYYKNQQGTKENNGWWYFYDDKPVPFNVGPTHIYRSSNHMQTYMGLWSKDVLLFDNYEEAKDYSNYISCIINIDKSNKNLKILNNTLNKNGTLEEAIQNAIEQVTQQWKSDNACILNNIKCNNNTIERYLTLIDSKYSKWKNI